MRAALALLLAALLPAAARAADAPLRLAPGMALAKGVAGAPRIVSGPPAPVVARVNAALARLDARGAKSVRSCREDLRANPQASHSDDGWRRRVKVTFAGPRFLSVLVQEDYDCATMYPNTGDEALVFDLQTGRPVDWRPLAPASLHAEAVTGTAPDGATLGYFAAPAFGKLLAKPADECPDADSLEGLQIALRPDRLRGGLVLALRGFNHATQACESETTLRPAQLRRLGFAPELVEALSHPAP